MLALGPGDSASRQLSFSNGLAICSYVKCLIEPSVWPASFARTEEPEMLPPDRGGSTRLIELWRGTALALDGL